VGILANCATRNPKGRFVHPRRAVTRRTRVGLRLRSNPGGRRRVGRGGPTWLKSIVAAGLANVEIGAGLFPGREHSARELPSHTACEWR
jgi:hypothetical protein